MAKLYILNICEEVDRQVGIKCAMYVYYVPNIQRVQMTIFVYFMCRIFIFIYTNNLVGVRRNINEYWKTKMTIA